MVSLQEFDFTVNYRPGKANQADPISRIQLHEEEEESIMIQPEISEPELSAAQSADPVHLRRVIKSFNFRGSNITS